MCSPSKGYEINTCVTLYLLTVIHTIIKSETEPSACHVGYSMIQRYVISALLSVSLGVSVSMYPMPVKTQVWAAKQA